MQSEARSDGRSDGSSDGRADSRSESRRHGRTRFGLRLRRIRARWLRLSQPLLGPLRARWRNSLRLRMMTIAGIISILMIAITGGLVLDRISSDLYSSRKDQVLQDSARATLAAQRQMDASDATDRGAVAALVASVRSTLQGTSSSQLIYVKRQAMQSPSQLAPDDFNTSQQLVDVVSPELSEALLQGDAPQYWQAVTLVDDDGVAAPGILVASTLIFPAGAGTYELYIGYSLADAKLTLQFIVSAFVFMAVLLLVLLAVLVWVISSLVFRPIRTAATASHRIAGGEREVRMPMHGDRHFDELSENFNTMADTLHSRIDELDTLSDMQQRFVSDVSHELRTPLTTIKLVSELLKGQAGDLEPQQARAIEVLGTQVDRFEALLADLLEISRYDAGPITLETEPTNLATLTEEVVDALRPLSESEIEVNQLGGFSPIDVDPRRIRRIVSNLVGNAIEHGEGKPIVVTIDSNAAAIAIGVHDWGVGMKPEDTEHVFDRCWRADPSRKRTLGGTGLGLAIAREDAAVHGGLLEVWSRPGEGSNFRLTLPRGDDTTTFISPVPLVPLDVTPDETDPEITGGWLRRPGRRVKKKGSR
ncbi:MAG: HAMP domain-containing histidine kinase [Leucobacter sp.]|nr:HAMP domain-containing histidine kinase [Leucobacter sp.]